MKHLVSFISPWALAAIGAWLVVGVIAFVWAIPIYANVGDIPLCGEPGPGCSSTGTFSVNVGDTLVFAIIVASGVVALLAGILWAGRWLRGRQGRDEPLPQKDS